MGADASEQLDDGFVVAGGDAGLAEDGLAEVGVADAEGELLLFGGHLVRCDGLDVFKGLLGGLEGLVGRDGHRLGEAFQRADGFLNFRESATSLIILFLLKETVPGGRLVQDKHLHANY